MSTPEAVKKAYVKAITGAPPSDSSPEWLEFQLLADEHFGKDALVSLPDDMLFAVGRALYQRFPEAIDLYLRTRGEPVWVSHSKRDSFDELLKFATGWEIISGRTGVNFYVLPEKRAEFDAAVASL